MDDEPRITRGALSDDLLKLQRKHVQLLVRLFHVSVSRWTFSLRELSVIRVL